MSYILHKNDTPTWAYPPDLPASLPPLPPCFSPPPSAHLPGKRLELPSLDEKWVNKMDEEEENNDFIIVSKFRRLATTALRRNPFVPFTLRATVFLFSIIGLGLAARIFVLTKIQGRNEFHQQPSVIMSLVVLSVAIPYLCYSTYNEFFGQPLGLRSALSKMSFILVDLIFIIFASSNLSLAFNTLYDSSWICQVEQGEPSVCARQRDLVAMLFVSLVFWLVSFSVSLFRMIDRAAAT